MYSNIYIYYIMYSANGYATRAPFIYPCRDPIHIQPNGHNIDDHFGSRSYTAGFRRNRAMSARCP